MTHWPVGRPSLATKSHSNKDLLEDSTRAIATKKPNQTQMEFNSNESTCDMYRWTQFLNKNVRRRTRREEDLLQARECRCWRRRDVDGSHCFLLKATQSSNQKKLSTPPSNQNAVSYILWGEKKRQIGGEEERDYEPTANCIGTKNKRNVGHPWGDTEVSPPKNSTPYFSLKNLFCFDF